MKYYKLLYDYENDVDYVGCSIGNIYEKSEYSVLDGKSLSNWNCNITFSYNIEDGYILSDYLANVYCWSIVSEKFRKALEGIVINEIQYLPVKIINNSEATINETYMVANIIDTLDALDLEKSVYDEYELDDEKIISVRKYALRKESIINHHIFKLKSDTIPVFVSENVKVVIEKNKLLGFDFIEVYVS